VVEEVAEEELLPAIEDVKAEVVSE